MVNGAQQATDQNSIPKILLLSGSAPGNGHVGEIYLRDLCLSYPLNRICAFALVPGNSPCQPASGLEEMSVMVSRGRREHVYASLAPKYGKMIALLAGNLLLSYHVQRIADQVVSFAQQHGVERIWAVLDSAAIVYLAEEVSKRTNLPLVTHVWDVPEHFSQGYAVTDGRRKKLMNSFGRVMRRSLRCGVISEQMGCKYQESYDIDPVVMRAAVAYAPFQRREPLELSDRECLTIGFAGMLYATDAWQALLQALHSVGWHIAGKKVLIQVLGPHLQVTTHQPVRVEYLGWRSSEETMKLLSEVDICYLPYWFDPKYEAEVRFAFPSKLSTYLGAGRSVFFHGPSYASVATFLERFPAGICCHSLSETDIVNVLTRLATDTGLIQSMQDAANDALSQELSMQVFRKRFAQLIGVDYSLLKQEKWSGH